jgi:predicted RNase H-like nuclease
VAIDASLVVKNKKGQRPCETEIGQNFAQFHASCHTTNTKRPYWNTGMDLAQTLGATGFRHDFDIHTAKQRPGRWLFEVYPHPAMVRVFGLKKIIKYKKGTAEQKRAGLMTFRGYMRNLASGS